MKLVVSLSTLALISISNIAPCLATSQPSSKSINQSTSSQTGLNESNSFQVAGLLDDAFKVIKKVDRYNKQRKTIIENKTKDDARRRRQEELALERQQRLAAYQKQREGRRAALQAKRQQEQDYFNSLSPEQRQAYLEKQRAQQAQTMAVWLGLFSMMSSGSTSTSTQPDEWKTVYVEGSQPTYKQDTAAVNPFYGSCHGGSFYGCK